MLVFSTIFNNFVKNSFMFFPIGDTQVENGYKPILSYTFIGLNILVWLWQLSTVGNGICEWSVIPVDIVSGKGYATLITSMFMHGGWMHLIGNMLFLWVFADNIEARFGSLWFLLFYIGGGLAASAFHIGFDLMFSVSAVGCCLPCSTTIATCVGQVQACAGSVPSLGASGAIAAVLGAYLVMYPKSQIKVYVLILFNTIKIPAILFLGIWFAQQLFSGIGGLSDAVPGGGVAWWAHIGGFVFGLLIGLVYRKPELFIRRA